jgi:hypothetical protein
MKRFEFKLVFLDAGLEKKVVIRIGTKLRLDFQQASNKRRRAHDDGFSTF